VISYTDTGFILLMYDKYYFSVLLINNIHEQSKSPLTVWAFKTTLHV